MVLPLTDDHPSCRRETGCGASVASAEQDEQCPSGVKVMRLLLIGVIAVLLSADGAFAASRTLTGTISHSRCGASHKAMAAQHGGNVTDAA